MKQKYRYHFILMVSLLMWGTTAQAQQESQYTQYIYNTMTINPAYTGARGRLSVLALYRNQWVGIEGAPKTLNISAHTPVGDKRRVGLGVEFVNDEIGPSVKNRLAVNFSYVIPFSDGFHLAFGVKGGFTTLTVDPNKLNPAYPMHNLDLSNHFMPVLGIGAYFYGEKWYLGLSTPNLLETKYYDDVKVSTATKKMHLYLIGGYLFKINDRFHLKPSALVKAVEGAPMALDVSLNAIFSERFSLGLSYCLNASISALAAFKINENIMIGYAHDFTTTELAHYSNGTHEIFLRFELTPRSGIKGVSPYF